MKLECSLMIFCIAIALFWRFVHPLQIEKTLNDNTISNFCLEPKSSGICRDKLLRYAYDEKAKNCVSFVYSGCGATQNNFLTYEECRRDCVTKSRY